MIENPNLSPVSDWQADEVISQAQIFTRKEDCLVIPVPIYLPERRIYVYLETYPSTAASCKVETYIIAKRAGSIVGKFPASIADLTSLTPTQSVPNLFNSGGSPVGDSLVLKLARPFDAAVTTVVVQPLRVNADIDSITLSIASVTGASITGFRAYLGCLSTKY